MRPLPGIALASLLSLLGCQSDPVFCDCGEVGLGISIPADRIDDVATVTASGPGCESAVMMPYPRVFWVAGRAAGTCHVEVTFRSGAPTFRADAELVPHSEGCCNGYIGEGIIVPDLDAGPGPGSDAGADGPLDASPAVD
jgi:hypothetical protein